MNAIPSGPAANTKARPVKISCRNVWKVYGERPDSFFPGRNGRTGDAAATLKSVRDSRHIAAAADVSFDVHAGEIFIIMGLSGSGKSTMVRCLSRLVEPTAGEIMFDGNDLLRASRQELTEIRRRKMGMVFQNFGLMPHLNVIDNVMRPLFTKALFERQPHPPVVAERLKGGRGEGVYGLRPYERFDVINVGVSRVLRRSGSPQRTLHLRALLFERAEPLAVKHLLEYLISHLRVGYGDLPLERAELLFLFFAVALCDHLFEPLIHGRVDAAHKEARYTAHPCRVTATPDECRQTFHVRAGDGFVARDAKEQRDVDVDTFARQLTNRGKALDGRWHLDHDVLATDGLPEAPRFLDRRPGVVGQVRGHFHADVAVRTSGPVIERAKQIRGIADVANRECLVQRLWLQIATPLDVMERVEVIGTAGDGLFED